MKLVCRVSVSANHGYVDYIFNATELNGDILLVEGDIEEQLPYKGISKAQLDRINVIEAEKYSDGSYKSSYPLIYITVKAEDYVWMNEQWMDYMDLRIASLKDMIKMYEDKKLYRLDSVTDKEEKDD